MSDPIDVSLSRAVGDVVFQATVREAHNDELQLTDHPVELGAPITDHAFNLPKALVIEAGSSNSSEEAAGDPDFIRNLYDDLLAMKETAQVIDVVTGKRIYENMVIRGIAVTTDVESEFILKVTLTLRQVIIVETQVATVPPKANQADPTKTAAVQPMGTVQPTPAPAANQSALSQLFGQ